MGAFNLVSRLIPAALDTYLSDSIVAYLNRISRLSEMELNRICSVIEQKHTEKYPGLREQLYHSSGLYLTFQKGKSAHNLHTTRHELLIKLTRIRTNSLKSETIQPKNEGEIITLFSYGN